MILRFHDWPELRDGPALLLLAEDVTALERMVRLFRTTLYWRLPPSAGREAACEGLAELQQRLALAPADEESSGRWIARADLSILERVLQMMQIFLFLLVPPSEQRQQVIESLWDTRERLYQLRKERSHLN
ncbi:MAG: hypothetical protein IMW89_22535 [Ktedonobacteraceae bacterium]|nr:hypothetical protein [Ktedonobacteraceae bacterium]